MTRAVLSLAVLCAACGRDFSPPPCTTAIDGCGAGTRCEASSGSCVPCDVDRDGYLYDAPSCAITTDRPPDCDDGDRSVHPGGVAICGDGRVNVCDVGTHDALRSLLPVAEASTFDLAIATVPMAMLEDQRVAVGLTQGGATGGGVAHVAWSVRGTGRHELQLASFPLDAATDAHVALTTDASLHGAFAFDARWVDLRWAGPGDPNAVALVTYGAESMGIHEHAGGYLRDLASGDVYSDVLSDDTGYGVDMPTAAPMAMTGGGAASDGTPLPLRVTHERDWPGHGITLFSSMPTAEVPDATSLVSFDDAFPPVDIRASDGRWALIAARDVGRLWTWNAATPDRDMRLYAPRPLAPELTTVLAPFTTAPAFARLGDGELYVVAVFARSTMWWGLADMADPDGPLRPVVPRTTEDPYFLVTQLAADHVPDHELAVIARAHPADLSATGDAPFVTLAFVPPSLDYALWAEPPADYRFAPNELHHAPPMSTGIPDLHVAAITARDGAVDVVIAGIDVNPYEGQAFIWASGVRICERE